MTIVDQLDTIHDHNLLLLYNLYSSRAYVYLFWYIIISVCFVW